eukprot:TRINITY_DN67934_c0_g1_i1.p1 TRINITY_DN67934_c0_g1~~TRINITY_DN67934_c0_g1_i1.p1  ORF type:complete len:174 (-),score=60.79 TRINITY_DN67934_c0_g1_i1:32-553(-)
MNSLSSMTPVDYLSRHVTISSSRRQLYDKVFSRHRSQRDGLLSEEGTLLALGEVMGGSVTADLATKIWASVGVEIAPHIENKFNYKQFAGIAAITERIFCWNFSKGEKAGPTAPKSEIETADFDKLLCKLEQVTMPEVLRDLLVNLKESGQPRPGSGQPRRKFSKNQNIFDFL